jgi:hypothetical protein
MATLRRILKYTPAVVLGLLVLAWVASCFASFTLRVGLIEIALSQAMVVVIVLYRRSGHPVLEVNGEVANDMYLGMLYAGPDPFGGSERWHFVPLPTIITALLPLAIGPFISFRFRLWHYLAYTALVAVELAYYLRWQE